MSKNDDSSTFVADNASRQTEELPPERLAELIARNDHQALEELIEERSPSELARAVSRLSTTDLGKLVALIQAQSAADLMEQLPAIQALQLLDEADPSQAADVLIELPSDMQADMLAELDSDDAEDILDQMEPEQASDVRQLQEYDELSAGGLMVTELLRYPASWTLGMVIEDLERGADEYRDYQIQYAYVCDEQDRLLGVLRLRDLLLGKRNLTLRQIMIESPHSVRVDQTLEELHNFFLDHHFLGVPVVDQAGQLLGVVQRTDVDQAWIEQQDRSFLRRQGIVSGEEIRSLPVWQRSRGRLMWLSLNIVLNLLAAAIISHFESTLAAAIALTAFLPIISDMSGCSGNQAVAVSIRELMLGLIQPIDAFRVWLQELSVGLINGLVVGTLLASIAWVWKGNLVLAAVIGIALSLNTLVAVSIGGVVPLLLRRLGKDPAVASGPLLTTITDMCGFFLVLSLASMWIDYL